MNYDLAEPISREIDHAAPLVGCFRSDALSLWLG